MKSLSKWLLVAFEICNELYVALGAGVIGAGILLNHGFRSHQYLKTISVITLTSCCLIYINSTKPKIKASKKKVVCITGCDSGLGYSISQHAVDMGFTVIAGFLSLESNGSKEIRKLYGSNIIQIQIDVSDSSSVQAAVQTLEHFFSKNPEYSLHAVINNAGVMVFGEFEWLTENLIQHQIDVNLLGTLKFTNALCPLLRKYKGRLLTITSHCSQTTLPGLAVYGATKAALAAWSDGVRAEMAKYGVSVLTFLPGSFTLQSNLMARQLQHVQEMHDAFTPEQHTFYSDYFKRYNMYLSHITPPPKPVKIDDENLYVQFENTLLDKYPDVQYKNESLRYRIYYTLFRFTPIWLRDYLVKKFIQMPEYVPAENDDCVTSD